MLIYLDDNFVDRALESTLLKTGHSAFRPANFGLSGASDTRHLEHAIRQGLAVLTKDRDDYHELHQLVLTCGGRHPGIIVVRYENDTTRDMRTGHIVKAVGKLERSGMSLINEWVILNQWR